MHVEPLEKLPRSVREFLSHYAMIVLSILTALALEQLLVAMEHRHQGERARNEIEQEITFNRRAVEESLAATRVNKKQWEAMLSHAAGELKAGESSNDSRLAVLAQARDKFGDAVPPLKTTAWDAAVASHAVDYLDHGDLTRYSELYALQRFFSQAMWDTVRDSAVRNLTDLTLPYYTGTTDAVSTLAVLNSRVRVLGILESQLSQVDMALKTPVGENAPAATSAPASR